MYLGSTNFTDSIYIQQIQERLTRLLIATGNRIDREWPSKYAGINSGKVLVHTHYLSAFNTYNTILYVIAEIPKDPHRKLSFSLAIPPLVRYLYESFVSHIFLLADFRRHLELLFKSGYREHVRELENAEKYHQGDPEWTSYIDTIKNELVRLQAELKLTDDEIGNPKKFLQSWLTPKEMRDKLLHDSGNRNLFEFLEYIDSWMYRALSCEAHISLPGLIDRLKVMSSDVAKEVFGEDKDEKIEQALLDHRNVQLHFTLCLMLAIATEVHTQFKFADNNEFLYIWNFFIKDSYTFEDLYKRRYSALL